MEPFVSHTGKAVVIDLANIDTDQIIPKQFLTRIERTGYGQFLFYDRRFDAAGVSNPDFVLNRPESAGASILIAGENFACGSSREHAPWSLLDFGFRVVIAPSFADIFYSNSLKNGLLPVALSRGETAELMRLADSGTADISIDLPSQAVTTPAGFSARFEIDPFRKNCLLNGLDDIGLTLSKTEAIAAFEKRRQSQLPFLAFPAN